MRVPTRPASINGIEFDALINQSEVLDATVPSYPIESGYQVSDSIIVSPISLDITAFITDTPVTWSRRFGGRRSTKAVCDQLKRLFFGKKLVTFRTSDAIYLNMGITSITIPKTPEGGTACEVSMKLQQVSTTRAKTVAVVASYSRGGATGTNAGTANTTATAGASSAGGGSSKAQSKEEGKKASSILYGVANSIGLIK